MNYGDSGLNFYSNDHDPAYGDKENTPPDSECLLNGARNHVSQCRIGKPLSLDLYWAHRMRCRFPKIGHKLGSTPEHDPCALEH